MSVRQKYKEKFLMYTDKNDILLNYFVASSHNTVLSHGQFFGASESRCIFPLFLEHFKGGCVELDFGSFKIDDFERRHYVASWNLSKKN
jgi:hypothetical protein